MNEVLMRIPRLNSQGFTLIEVMAAVMIISMAVVGSMTVLSATVRTANRSEGNVKLLQLVRSQIETIKHFEFQDDPAGYPIIEVLKTTSPPISRVEPNRWPLKYG